MTSYREQDTVISIPAVTCQNCALYQTAQVLGLEQPDCSTLNDVVLRDHPVKKNETLYRTGDPFQYLYLVHSGACASYANMASGTNQVMGFYLPGEIAGISSIGQSQYSHTTITLEKGSICRLDYPLLDNRIASNELLRVQDYLLHATAEYAHQLQWERSLMGLQTAEQRVTAFLLNILNRLRKRGLPWQYFRLPMSRSSIAEYLGLASETVIRVLQSLHNRQLISIKAKHISILNKADLEAVLHPFTD